MKRSFRTLATVTTGAAALLYATPAFAQTYGDDAAGAAVGFGVLACWGVALLASLALFVFNIWMLIDSIARQEYEYPDNNKTLWVILLVAGVLIGFGWIVALVYYFSIYKKVKRGTVSPPWTQQGAAPGAPSAPAAPPAAPTQPQAPAPPAQPTAPPQQPTPPGPPPAPPAPPTPPAPPAPPENPPGSGE